MTYPDASPRDGWSWPALREPRARSWRLSNWVDDPLERTMLYAIVVVSAVLLWTLVVAEDDPVVTTRDVCVVEAVDAARAFADVLGDDRPIPVSFAEQACARR